MVFIQSKDGKSPSQKVSEILSRVAKKLQEMDFADEMRDQVREHFGLIYPNSKHYSPTKVNSKGKNLVEIAVAGVTRAYHDIDIYPINAKALTIPIDELSYGRRASEIEGLFLLRKRNGKAFLAKSENGMLVFMYYLCKHVHQNQNPNLMPSDESLANKIFEKIKERL